MLKIVKVPMPKKKVYVTKRNNVNYVYYILRAYRNSKGQPTCDSVLIGKKDIQTGQLIPNDNYFDYYDCEITVRVNGEKNNKETVKNNKKEW